MEDKSKSQRKREVELLQRQAIAMSKLPDKALALIPLPPRLKQALLDYRNIKSHGAKFRQGQYLGKLMRELEVEPILEAFEKVKLNKAQNVAQFHLFETWTQRLIAEGKPALTQFMQEYPHSDSQTLRQLIKKAIHDQTLAKNTGAKKKLHRLIATTINGD